MIHPSHSIEPPYTKYTISSLIPLLNWAIFAMLGVLSEGLQIFFQLHKKRNNVWRFVLLWFFSLCNIVVVGFGFCQPKVSNLFWWFFIFSLYKQEKCGDVHKMSGFYAFLVIFFVWKRLMGLTFFSFSPTPWWIGGNIWGGNNKVFFNIKRLSNYCKKGKSQHFVVKWKINGNIIIVNGLFGLWYCGIGNSSQKLFEVILLAYVVINYTL